MTIPRTSRSVCTAGLAVASLLVALLGAGAVSAEEPRPFQPADVHRLQNVSNLAISPDGEWVAYTVRSTDIEEDRRSSDLFMVSWDGTTKVQLTHTEKGSEGHPRFSPDGKYLAFITSRSGDDDDKKPEAQSQVWLLNRAGGEARRLTALPGGVSSFEWSPDSQRLVLSSGDPDPFDIEMPAELDGEPDQDGTDQGGSSGDAAKAKKKSKTRPPIVIDRYQFKRDREGYLVDRYERLYAFDLASENATLLTEGNFDSSQPAWSPDSQWIAFSSKRPSSEQPDPDRHPNSNIYLQEAKEGSSPRRLTDWQGSDSQPVWSPDGKTIAYVRGPLQKYDFYSPGQLGLVSVDGGEPALPTEELDRAVRNIQWSGDGQSVFFRFDDDRDRFVGTVPVRGGKIERLSVPESALRDGVVSSYQVGKKGIAVIAASPNHPPEVYRLADGLALTDHNKDLREEIKWATVRGIETTAKDGKQIGSMLYEPPNYDSSKAYPTVAFIHGGPVGLDGFDFDWMAQAFAAAGYVVVQPNYRGSSGRGGDFSRTLYAKWADGVQDINAVMDDLVERKVSDPKRLGIGGWSYGGINTNYAIATDTRWSAAVSGSGIANLLTGYGTDQYIWQYETEIGKPWVKEDLKRYLDLSFPFLHADRIKTPTLFMCGEKDFNVPLINSEQMYQALRSQNVPTQLVIYPGQYHGLSVPSYLEDRVVRMIGWYDEHLSK